MGLIRFLMKSTLTAAVGLGGYYLGTVKTGQNIAHNANSPLEQALSQYNGKLEGACSVDASQPGKYTITMDYSSKSAKAK